MAGNIINSKDSWKTGKLDPDTNEPVDLLRVFIDSFKGEFTQSGLSKEGKITIVAVNSSTWTALPASALSERNAMSIQNYSDEEIKLNYDPTVVGYVGLTMLRGTERYYDITDNIIIYAKAKVGTFNITIEELA